MTKTITIARLFEYCSGWLPGSVGNAAVYEAGRALSTRAKEEHSPETDCEQWSERYYSECLQTVRRAIRSGNVLHLTRNPSRLVNSDPKGWEAV